jgi:plastocyanin
LTLIHSYYKKDFLPQSQQSIRTIRTRLITLRRRVGKKIYKNNGLQEDMIMKRLRLASISALAVLAVVWTTYLVRANVNSARKINDNAAVENAHHSTKATSGNSSTNFGILSNATVSFGSWMTTPAVDRLPPNDPNPRAANHHELIPQLALIKAGGTVNFIIAGFHNVVVYDDGTKPDDINSALTIPPAMGGPPLINDPNRRIYRGLDPSTVPSQDRVEVVQFANPGTYLVICGVQPHFREGMYGFVKVLR